MIRQTPHPVTVVPPALVEWVGVAAGGLVKDADRWFSVLIMLDIQSDIDRQAFATGPFDGGTIDDGPIFVEMVLLHFVFTSITIPDKNLVKFITFAADQVDASTRH
jgi:hypothetical protein